MAKSFIDVEQDSPWTGVIIHVLKCMQWNEPFMQTTDASAYAIGAVLCKGRLGEDHLVAYASKSSNSTERNYSVTEKECLSVVSFTSHFRHFLLGRKITVVTEQQELVWLHSVKDPSSRLMRWRLRLSDYDYEIRCHAGKTLQNADGLSRNPVNDSVGPVFVVVSNPKRKPGRPREQVKFRNVPMRLFLREDPIWIRIQAMQTSTLNLKLQ